MSESEIRAAQQAAEHQAVTADQHPVQVPEAEMSRNPDIGYSHKVAGKPRQDPGSPA